MLRTMSEISCFFLGLPYAGSPILVTTTTHCGFLSILDRELEQDRLHNTDCCSWKRPCNELPEKDEGKFVIMKLIFLSMLFICMWCTTFVCLRTQDTRLKDK